MRDKPRLLRVGTNVGHWVKTDGTMLQGDPLQYGAVCFKSKTRIWFQGNSHYVNLLTRTLCERILAYC
jgi:hypothetical protein